MFSYNKKVADERRDSIIDVIVSAFLETGEPVGSVYAASKCGFDISPATARNIMRELEEDGYLFQPHISAGRIPTVKCYKYYVKYLMPQIKLEQDEIKTITLLIENIMRENDADVFMNHIASVLSEVTDLVGVTLSTVFEQGIFEKIDIINLETYKYLLVISLKNGIVKTINLTLDRIIPRTKTEETARLLTNRLYGLKVSEIRNTIGKRVEGVSVADRKLLDVIIDKSARIFSFFDERNIHISGIKKLLTKPDFAVPEYYMNLIDFFEHKHELAATLKNTMGETEDVNINIGCSDIFFSAPPLSIISATYHFGGIPGVIAVLGPTRIHYPKLFSIIKYTASETSKYLSS